MEASSGSPSVGQWLGDALRSVTGWVERHQSTLEVMALWGAIAEVVERTQLYVPRGIEAWLEIMVACERVPDEELREVVLGLYAPGGVGHDALCTELDAAPLLSERRQEVSEVIASVRDERYYVAICGVLPLIEGVLMSARGKWIRMDKVNRELEDAACESGKLTPDELSDLLGAAGAVSMVLHDVPAVWKDSTHTVGAVREELRRHFVAHGTATGWATRLNAVRAMLLLAASARVAGPLLAPRQ
jgi:hypothetical protein